MDTAIANKHTRGLKRSSYNYCDAVFSYLSDPFERLCAQLYAIQAKESNGTLRGDANHEEFVVRGQLHIANISVHKGLPILAVVYLPRVLLVVDVDVQLAITNRHQASLIVLNIVQCGELGDGQVDLRGLERIAVQHPV